MKLGFDKGHGLGSRTRGVIDSGAVGNGRKEYQVAAAIVDECVAEAKRRGHKTMIPVGNYTTRDQQADAWGAQALVSVHLNADAEKGDTKSPRGTETIVHTHAGAKSIRLAHAIQSRVVKTLGTIDRGVKAHGYAVLAGKCSAVLVEVAFIDSFPDMQKLLASGAIKRVAIAIVDGIEEAFDVKPKPAPKVRAYVVTATATPAQYPALVEFLKTAKIRSSAKPLR